MAEIPKNPRYKLSLKFMVAGFPTAGRFAGYLIKGMTNKTEHIINDKKIAFFLSSENGRNFRLKA